MTHHFSNISSRGLYQLGWTLLKLQDRVFFSKSSWENLIWKNVAWKKLWLGGNMRLNRRANVLIQKEFFLKWGYKTLDQAVNKAHAASRENCASFLGLGLSWLLLSHRESRGDVGIGAGFPLTPSTSSNTLQALCPGARPACSPRPPLSSHNALGYGTQAGSPDGLPKSKAPRQRRHCVTS